MKTVRIDFKNEEYNRLKEVAEYHCMSVKKWCHYVIWDEIK